jgi:hypothetical protein
MSINMEEPEDIQMQLLPPPDQKDEVEIVHDLQLSGALGANGAPIGPVLFQSMHAVAKVFLGVYFTYYTLLLIPLTVCYFVQFAQVKKDLPEMSDVDVSLFKWFRFGLYFAFAAFCVYSINLIVIAKIRIRSRLYYILLFMLIMVVKIIYYSWAVDGVVLYLGDVRESESEIEYKVFQYGLTFLSILNLMDAARTAAMIIFVLVFHCIC